MPEVFLERRRVPRVSLPDHPDVGVPLSVTVRLVDISTGGVLIASTQRMAIGQRARLHTTLGSEPFIVEVEVRRVTEAGSEGNGRGRYRMGAVFTSVDEHARRSMEHFLSGDVQ